MNYKDYIASPDRGCAVVVHRGLWNEAPENSLLAVERTIEAGHRVVEVDIRKTADGGLVLLHDDTFLRMTGLDQAPESLTLEQISGLRLRNRDGGEGNSVTDEQVPTLEDLFAITRGRLFIHLDVKRREIIPEVLAAAQRAGVLGQVDFWNNLRTTEDLSWFREVFDGHDVVVMPKTRLNARDADHQLDLAFALKPVVCEFVYDALIDIEAVHDRFRKAGIATWCNTLDGVACGGHTDTAALDRPKEVWGALLDAGVSVIQTDYAAQLDVFLGDRTTVGRT
jgi:hypothetical protein